MAPGLPLSSGTSSSCQKIRFWPEQDEDEEGADIALLLGELPPEGPPASKAPALLGEDESDGEGDGELAPLWTSQTSSVNRWVSQASTGTRWASQASSGGLRSLSGVSRRSSRRSRASTVYSDHVERVLALSSPDLLRGVPFAKVLQCFGHVWASSQGRSEDFELSRKVDHIDYFLSHAWATPRLGKVIGLMIYFNFLPGIFVAAMAAIVAFLASLSGLLTVGNVDDVYFIAGESCWLIALALVHELYRLAGSTWQPTVFLDKLCIHQTDENLKFKGIQSLPAFLERSRTMVILYSREYLTRLWTIYELATYLVLQPGGHVEFLPVDIPLLPLLGNIVCSFTPRSNFYEFWWIAEVVGLLVLAWLCRWLADVHDGICEAFKAFDMRQANCYFEEDRIVVERNVEAFMKHRGEVDCDASLDEALDAFNDIVREKVPALMTKSLGTIGIPYRIAIMVDIPGIVQVFNLLYKTFWTGDLLTVQTVDFVLTFAHWLFIAPLVLAAGVCVAKAFSGRAGCVWSPLALATIVLTLFLAESMLSIPFFALAFLAQHHLVAALGGLVVYVYLLLLWLFLVYGFPSIFSRRWGASVASRGSRLTEANLLEHDTEKQEQQPLMSCC